MPRGIFQRLSWADRSKNGCGFIRIEALGAVIGTIEQWDLRRRGDDDSADGLYDLRAVFSYVNPHLLNDPDYADDRLLVIVMGKGKRAMQFRVQLAQGEETVLTGRTLLSRGVSISVYNEARS